MCSVNKDFEKYVTYENNRKVLYLRVLRALYGCICSALLWYELFTTILQKEGYVLNPYDRCVANKVINNEQCTLVWYVDDNKVSHKDKNVVEEQMKIISEHFGDLSITRGDKFDFLAMKIELDRENK